MVTAEPKYYLCDIMPIEDPAKRIENLLALHLLKACHFWTDSAQGDLRLFSLRTKDKKEVNFFVTRDKKPWMLVECKTSSGQISPALLRFQEEFKPPFTFQLVAQDIWRKDKKAAL